MGEHERRHLIGRNQVIDSATRRASSFSCGDCPTYDAYPIIENDEPYPFYVGQTGSLYAYEAWNDQYGNAGQYPVDAYYSVTPSGVESINDQIGWSSVSALNGGRATVGYVYQWSQSQWDGLECIWDSGESDESFQDVVNDPTPNITQVVPSSWNAGMNTSVRVLGSGFGTNPRVTITDPSSSVSVLSVTPVNDGEVDLVIAVSAFAPSESATIMVSSNGYNGQGFFAPAGNSPMSNQLSIPIYPLQVSQSPGTLDVSTGDTSDYITVSISPSGSYSLAFSTGLASNPNSNASATLSAQGSSSASGTANYTVTASGSAASASGIFSALACVSGKCSSQGTTVIVPPQVLIQVLYGEAHGQAAAGDSVSEPAIGASIRDRFGRREFPGGTDAIYQEIIISSQYAGINTTVTTGTAPELGVAASLFSGAQSDIVAGSPCFFSPDPAGWSAIQAALNSGTSTVPSVSGDPNCYGRSTPGRQIVYKSSIGNNTRYTGVPAFVFERQKTSDSDPAVIQIN